MTTPADRDSRRLNAALWLVLRRYGRQIAGVPGSRFRRSILPGIGDVLVFYAPPLVVARLLGAFARDEALTVGTLAPYVLTFTALWLAGEVVWRGAEALIARAEIRGIEALYIEAMDELLAKDLAFFHDNFAGSLTKRTLGYARRFEDVFDVLCVLGRREDLAAGVRRRGALALLAAADRRAARHAGDHRWRSSYRASAAGGSWWTSARRRPTCWPGTSPTPSPTPRPSARSPASPTRRRSTPRNVLDFGSEDAAVVGLPELARRHRSRRRCTC